MNIPQKPIEDDETERLIRAMLDALRFLTIEAPPGGKYGNAMRIREATETLSIPLSNYKTAIDDMHARDAEEYRKFEASMAHRPSVN